MGLVFFLICYPIWEIWKIWYVENTATGCGNHLPAKPANSGNFFGGLFLICLWIPGDFPSSCVFIIYSARMAGDTARKTATTKLMRLLQVRAKVIWGKYRFWFFETFVYQKPDFEQGVKSSNLWFCELFVDFINYLLILSIISGGRL